MLEHAKENQSSLSLIYLLQKVYFYMYVLIRNSNMYAVDESYIDNDQIGLLEFYNFVYSANYKN